MATQQLSTGQTLLFKVKKFEEFKQHLGMVAPWLLQAQNAAPELIRQQAADSLADQPKSSVLDNIGQVVVFVIEAVAIVSAIIGLIQVF